MATTYIGTDKVVLQSVLRHSAITFHAEFGDKSLDIVFDEEKLINALTKFIPKFKEEYAEYVGHVEARTRGIENLEVSRIRVKIGDKIIEADEKFETTHNRRSLGFKIKGRPDE